MEKIDVSIVITNYNRSDLITNCLSPLYKYTKGMNYEVIVVDDCSKDDSVKIIKKKFPKVRLMVNKQNLGAVASANKGFLASKGKYIVMGDNDVIFLNNVLKKMMDFMEKNEDIGVVGCKLVNKDKTFQQSCGPMFKPNYRIIIDTLIDKIFPNNKITGAYKETKEAHDNIMDVDYFLGVCSMFRRETLKQVGLIDEQFFLGADEYDWFYRIRKRGWRIVHLPYGPIIHYGSASSVKSKDKKTSEKFELMTFRNSIIFYKKNYGELSSLAYRLRMSSILIKDIIKFLFTNNFQSIRIKTKMINALFKPISLRTHEPKIN